MSRYRRRQTRHLPVVYCDTCQHGHVETHKHCTKCGQATLFIKRGLCLTCRNNKVRRRGAAL